MDEECASDQALSARLLGDPDKLIPFMDEVEPDMTDEEEESGDEFLEEVERLYYPQMHEMREVSRHRGSIWPSPRVGPPPPTAASATWRCFGRA